MAAPWSETSILAQIITQAQDLFGMENVELGDE